MLVSIETRFAGKKQNNKDYFNLISIPRPLFSFSPEWPQCSPSGLEGGPCGSGG